MTDYNEKFQEITAAGGWCAPPDMAYGLAAMEKAGITLPEFVVNRGGIDYTQFEPTPEQKAVQAYVDRLVGNIREAQDDAIDDACATALANGWDIYLDQEGTDRFVGIAFVPARHAIPTIHRTGYNEWGIGFCWDDLYEED